MRKLFIVSCILFPSIASAGNVEYKMTLPKDPPRQVLAQKRIDAKLSWDRVRTEIKDCIDSKLEIDGLTVVELISHGMLPSDAFLKQYREECFFEVLGKRKELTPN